MSASPGLFIFVALAVVAVLGLKFWTKGGIFPPHEFAYGAELPSAEAIPEVMNEFLSLEGLDPSKVGLKTYVGNRSEKNLKPLIRFISSERDPDLRLLVTRLREVDRVADQREKAILLVKTLLPYRDALRDELAQDSIIVFVSYALRVPRQLPEMLKGKVADLVRQLDTPKQSAAFDSGKCPENYLVGNINVYPLALENTSWHGDSESDSSKQAPILEVRFMGLGGIFRYLLNEIEAKTHLSFTHLDGDSL